MLSSLPRLLLLLLLLVVKLLLLLLRWLLFIKVSLLLLLLLRLLLMVKLLLLLRLIPILLLLLLLGSMWPSSTTSTRLSMCVRGKLTSAVESSLWPLVGGGRRGPVGVGVVVGGRWSVCVRLSCM